MYFWKVHILVEDQIVRVAVPSDGALHEPALMFLRACGISVSRTNLRRYTATIPSLPGIIVHFQRGSDIAQKVEQGSADMGIVGFDRFLENRKIGGDANIVIDKLGFGHSELVVGVPDSWMDIVSISDLSDVALEFRQKGSDLRVATKYPRLVEQFLLTHGVNFFSLVASSGALEVAPSMGYADIIADISSTGVTLRENRLKTIEGGVIVASEACIIANTHTMSADPDKYLLAKMFVETIEAHLLSLDVYSVTANLRGEQPDQIASSLLEKSEIAGLRGPTISKVYSADGDSWFAATVIVEKDKLIEVVGYLRSIGGSSVTVSQPSYIFNSECEAAKRLIDGTHG